MDSQDRTLDGDRATMTLPEAALRLGIGKSTAYALACRGELPFPVITLGRRKVVSRALVERAIAGEAIPQSAGNGAITSLTEFAAHACEVVDSWGAEQPASARPQAA